MSSKPAVQTLSFGNTETTTVNASTLKSAQKRKQVDGGFAAADKYNRDDINDSRPTLKQLQDNNKRQKQLDKRVEDNSIKNSNHNRLQGGISNNKIREISDNKHRANIKTQEKLARETALYNVDAERFLQPSTQGSLVLTDQRKILTTRHLSQADLYEQASTTVKAKAFTLNGLQYGPYGGEFTRNGQYLLLAGEQGHVNILDWRNGKSLLEQQLHEHVFDACFLQDHTLYAVAQKRFVCLYDASGVKIHHLKNESMNFPRRLQFLPHHFLLVTGTQTGILSWRDITTGEMISSKTTGKGPVTALKQNPHNAVIHAGHNSGLVTLWTPNMPKPVVQMNSIRNGQVNDIAIDDSGNYMYVCGSEGSVKLWDLRKYQIVAETKLPRAATTCDLSQGGLLGLGAGPHMWTYRTSDFQKLGTNGKTIKEYGNDGSRHNIGPYITETTGGTIINKVRFVPYEDLLGVGIGGGYRQCIIPGAGAANFDSWEANPFETRTQRQERVVKGLLEKLQPDMITLDAQAFNVMTKADMKEHEALKKANFNESLKHEIDLEKKRMKGRGNVKNSVKRKKILIVDEKREKLEEHLQQKKKVQREKQKEEHRQQQKDSANGVIKSALDRFM